jgi:hypothetical protein
MACLALGLAVFTTVPAHAAVGEVYGPYILIDQASGHCIDNPNSSTSDNTTMIVYTCSGHTNQRWYNETAVTNSDYWTFNEVSRKCLTAKGASTADNAAIIQYTCNSGANERWVYQSVTCNCVNGTITIDGHQYAFDGYFKIKHLNTNRCITVKNASHTSGAALLQYNCDSAGSNVFMQYHPIS